jgi:hypothetical protein
MEEPERHGAQRARLTFLDSGSAPPGGACILWMADRTPARARRLRAFSYHPLENRPAFAH